MFCENILVESLYLRAKTLHFFGLTLHSFVNFSFFKEELYLQYQFYFPKKSLLIISYNQWLPSLKTAPWNPFSQLQYFAFATQIFPNNSEEANCQRKRFLWDLSKRFSTSPNKLFESIWEWLFPMKFISISVKYSSTIDMTSSSSHAILKEYYEPIIKSLVSLKKCHKIYWKLE